MPETVNPDRHPATPSPLVDIHIQLNRLPPTSRRRHARHLHPRASLFRPFHLDKRAPNLVARPTDLLAHLIPTLTTPPLRPPDPANTHRRRLPRRVLLPPRRRERRLRVQHLPQHLLRTASRRRVLDLRHCAEHRRGRGREARGSGFRGQGEEEGEGERGCRCGGCCEVGDRAVEQAFEM